MGNTVTPRIVTIQDIDIDNHHTVYQCGIKSKWFSTEGYNMTKLMKMVMLTRDYPNFINDIRDMVTENNNILHQRNSIGWTPLMLAIANSTTCSTFETVKLLLELGADCNVSKSDVKMKPLYLAIYYCNISCDIETVKILLEQPTIECRGYYRKRWFSRFNSYVDCAIYKPYPTVQIIDMLSDRGVYGGSFMDSQERIAFLQRQHISRTIESYQKSSLPIPDVDVDSI